MRLWTSKKLTRRVRFTCVGHRIRSQGCKVEGHGTSCDWWTLGILVHELLYGSPPFRGKNANDVFNELQEYEYFYPRVQFPKGFKQHETSFVKRLLHPNPRKRLGYGKTGSNNVMKHKFFMTLDFDKLERKAYVRLMSKNRRLLRHFELW